MRVVRMFDADYAITVSPDGTFSVRRGHSFETISSDLDLMQGQAFIEADPLNLCKSSHLLNRNTCIDLRTKYHLSACVYCAFGFDRITSMQRRTMCIRSATVAMKRHRLRHPSARRTRLRWRVMTSAMPAAPTTPSTRQAQCVDEFSLTGPGFHTNDSMQACSFQCEQDVSSKRFACSGNDINIFRQTHELSRVSVHT